MTGRRIVVAATGDAIATRRLPAYKDAGFHSLRQVLRGADVVFTNVETSLSGHEGTPVLDSGGMNNSGDPQIARDLRRLGINLASFANNHTLNYGERGMLLTLRALREANITVAGAGLNLADARMPAYLDVPAGRVALLAATSAFGRGHHAGAQRSDSVGRPGVNPLRYERKIVVDGPSLEVLRTLADRTGLAALRDRLVWKGFIRPLPDDQVGIMDTVFIAGEAPAIQTTPARTDLDDHLRWIEEARRYADLVFVSLHTHEQGVDMWKPASFVVEFARAAISVGASAVFCHGPHHIRGMELWQGKPIFYSLGNFIFEYEYATRIPADDYDTLGCDQTWLPSQVFAQMSANNTQGYPSEPYYWQSIVPVCTFIDGELETITVHPIALGFGAPWPHRGVPRYANESEGAEILERFEDCCSGLGTPLDVRGSVGRLEVSAGWLSGSGAASDLH